MKVPDACFVVGLRPSLGQGVSTVSAMVFVFYSIVITVVVASSVSAMDVVLVIVVVVRVGSI